MRGSFGWWGGGWVVDAFVVVNFMDGSVSGWDCRLCAIHVGCCALT